MEDRRFRVGSFFEWLAAVVGVMAFVWLLWMPVQRLLGPRVEAAPVDQRAPAPAGIPSGATSIPVMYLLDGREIRHGELQSRIGQMLRDKLAGPVVIGAGTFGERHTRAYSVDGAQFFVVCERMEAGGPMRVSAIYLP